MILLCRDYPYISHFLLHCLTISTCLASSELLSFPPHWVSCSGCFSAPSHPLLFQAASPALTFNPALTDKSEWSIDVRLRALAAGRRMVQVTCCTPRLLESTTPAWGRASVLGAEQPHTDGHGWNRLPKKFLAFPFPWLHQVESLSLAWFPHEVFLKEGTRRSLSCSEVGKKSY